jgi:hypothetical protein
MEERGVKLEERMGWAKMARWQGKGVECAVTPLSSHLNNIVHNYYSSIHYSLLTDHYSLITTH